jgi:hypothetical protein
MVIWAVLVMSLGLNGLFFVNNQKLKSEASARAIIDPMQTENVSILQTELISSQSELQKCVVELMRK